MGCGLGMYQMVLCKVSNEVSMGEAKTHPTRETGQETTAARRRRKHARTVQVEIVQCRAKGAGKASGLDVMTVAGRKKATLRRGAWACCP